MNKYKVNAEIEITIPTSKNTYKTVCQTVTFCIEAEDEYTAEQMCQDKIQFDYKFNVFN